MEVYIEYAIIDNFIVDYVLLTETARLLKVPFKKRNLFLASALGTAFAVVTPLLSLPLAVTFVIKVLSGMLVALFAVKHGGALAYVKFFNVFLLMTFLLGGIVIGILSLLGIPYELSAYYSNKLIPIGINVLFGFLLVRGVRLFIDFNASSVKISRDLYEAEIVVGGKSFGCVAFFDNGNRLYDEASGLPIIVCKRSFFQKISGKTRLKRRGTLLYNTAAGDSDGSYYYTDYVVVKKGKVGSVKHAFIMQGDMTVADADVLVGRGLV